MVTLIPKGFDMATTADCKKFLVNFFTRNPQVVEGLFRTQNDPTIRAHIADIKNWKRDYKCNPGGGNYEFDSYCLFIDGCRLNRWGDACPDVERPISDFVSERGFFCDHFEGQVGYIVLEDLNGNLHLGNYIGD